MKCVWNPTQACKCILLCWLWVKWTSVGEPLGVWLFYQHMRGMLLQGSVSGLWPTSVQSYSPCVITGRRLTCPKGTHFWGGQFWAWSPIFRNTSSTMTYGQPTKITQDLQGNTSMGKIHRQPMGKRAGGPWHTIFFVSNHMPTFLNHSCPICRLLRLPYLMTLWSKFSSHLTILWEYVWNTNRFSVAVQSVGL